MCKYILLALLKFSISNKSDLSIDKYRVLQFEMWSQFHNALQTASEINMSFNC